MFADHISYREYQRLLVELHALIAAGRNQSPEARRVRGQMEGPEAYLSEDEIVRLNALSADLAMTHGREIPDPDVVARVPAQEVTGLLESAYRRRRWEQVLELLRAGVPLPPDQIAYMRSRAYEALDELAPAVAFMDEAAKRVPNNANYRASALRLLWKSKRYEEAYARAVGYLADPKTKPRLVLMSGGIIAQRAMRSPEPVDLSAVAANVIGGMQQALPLETSPDVVFAGWVSLDLLAVQADKTNDAAEAFKEAIQLETASDEQVASSWVLRRELDLVRSGKAKTPEERANAQQLSEFVEPSRFAIAA